jgi:hypothetical protein
MTLVRSVTAAVCAALIGAALTAQGPEDRTTSRAVPSTSTARAPVTVLLDSGTAVSDWRVPVHTATADPVGGHYGLWASGPDYKASFHDGFAFYPVLGPRYPRNLPLCWRTASVRAGGVEVALQLDASAEHSDWQVRFRRGAMTEVYDLRAEGVEQSFVFAAPVGAPGDLVIRGAVATELRAERVEEQAVALDFRDAEGAAIVRYGNAAVFDAAGRTAPVLTSWDGSAIELLVPGDWLAGARYPVTVDPLTSAVVVSNWGGTDFGRPSYPDVVRNDESNQLYVTYSRSSSATDHDLHVRVTDDQFGGTWRIYSDVTASWSTRYSQVAYVGGSDRLAVAMARDFGTSSQIRFYVHDQGNTTENSGALLYLVPPSGSHDDTPSIGGTFGGASGTGAFCVFRRDRAVSPSNTQGSQIWGVRVDLGTVSPAVAPSFGTPLQVSEAVASYDCDWPNITQFSGGGTLSWVAVWQQYNSGISNDDWDVIGARIEHDGTIAGRDFFGSAYAATHKIRPKVAGMSGRYAVSYIDLDLTAYTTTAWGPRIYVHRFDWSETAAGATKQTERLLRSSTTLQFTTGDGNRSIAYDDGTDSHWAVAFHDDDFDVWVGRVGFRGIYTEGLLVYAGTGLGYSPSVTFDNDAGEFPLVFACDENAPAGQPVYGRRLQYREAAATAYGTSCAGALTGLNRGGGGPYKGSEFYTVRLGSGRAGAPTVLFAAFGSGNTPLPYGGDPSCRLLLSTASPLIDVAAGTSSATGTFAAPISISESVPDVALYWQTVQIDAGRLWSSTGLRTLIR